MRNDAASQIETCEIADSELDTISGGVAGAAVNAAGYGASVNFGDVVGTVESQVRALPISPLTGLVSAQTSPGM